MADVGTWYATIAGVTVPTLVLGDLSGGFTPYADFAGRGYWYRAAGSFTDYLWLGDTAANLAHNGKTLPTSFPARDEALAGTWEQVTEYGGTYGEIITTYVQFRPDPSYPYYDIAANGTRYRDAQGNSWLVVGDTSGSAGAYAEYCAPASSRRIARSLYAVVYCLAGGSDMGPPRNPRVTQLPCLTYGVQSTILISPIENPLPWLRPSPLWSEFAVYSMPSRRDPSVRGAGASGAKRHP